VNILFTVCGRAGSKGVHGKNMRDFCGIPLVWYTFAAISLFRKHYAAEDNFIQTTLNTDSEELIRLAAGTTEKMFVIHRTPDLATDFAPKVSVILDCLTKTEIACSTTFDVVVDLDITSPLRTVRDIFRAIKEKMEHPETDVVFSVTPSRRNPYFNMIREKNGFFVKAIPSNYTARQQAPTFYDMNASIYVYSPKALREKDTMTFFNNQAGIVLMRDTGILDIDSEEDFALMQVIAEHLYDTFAEYREVREHALRFLESETGPYTIPNKIKSPCHSWHHDE